MSREIVTVKVWEETRQKMRMLHALTGDSMQAIVDRLVSAEIERLHNPSSAHGDDDVRQEWESDASR